MRGEWVSIKDTLPMPLVDVLVYACSEYMTIRHYVPAAQAWYPGGLPIASSTHWMPLPEPPASRRRTQGESHAG